MSKRHSLLLSELCRCHIEFLLEEAVQACLIGESAVAGYFGHRHVGLLKQQLYLLQHFLLSEPIWRDIEDTVPRIVEFSAAKIVFADKLVETLPPLQACGDFIDAHVVVAGG